MRGSTGRTGFGRFLVIATVLVALLGIGSARPIAAQTEGETDGQAGEWTVTSTSTLWSGVTKRVLEGPGPVVARVVHVDPTAAVRLKPVVSNDLLGQGKETVTEMCSRVTGIACVNANFPICFSCVSPHGAVVRKHQILVTPVWHQWQISITQGQLSSEPWTWSAALRVALGPDGAAGAAVAEPLWIDAVNAAPKGDAIVLLNRHWAPTTGAPQGAYQVVFGAPHPLWSGGSSQPATLRGVVTDAPAAIPHDGVVLVGTGARAHDLFRFVEAHWTRKLDLVISSPKALETAISGHPLLLRHGVRDELDPADTKVTKDHPRTVIGWDADGATWLVVIDGRQESSIGLDLYETTEFMEWLGATDAVNLDGGGASTMSAWCGPDTGWCTLNRPSDGQQRLVGLGLAVVPESRY